MIGLTSGRRASQYGQGALATVEQTMKRITKPGETPGSGFREGRRGKACRGGKLYVFAKGEVVVVRGGERPAAWARTAKRPTWFSSPKLANAVLI